ncbi:MAG: hypothetical protein ACE5JM_07075, partial [Armatimonadota bacterium]
MLLVALAAQACDTPVYEYSIRYWDRDSYVVYYFHDGSDAPEDVAVNERLEQMKKSHANIWFQRIDVASLTSEGGMTFARQVWEHYSDQGAPLYVVITPRRVELFSGRLDLSDVETIAQSPKRTQTIKQLCEGKHGVLVLLKGPRTSENTEAERVVKATLAKAAEEEVEVGFVVVQRDDPKEKWLVRLLLSLEPDLKDLDNAMVFAVFGRGHVLEPYLGKGITERNLADVIFFMNGPCSCEIKMANPGVDLITDWNWQGHVAQMPLLDEAAPMEWALFDIEEPEAATEEKPAEEQPEPEESTEEPEEQPAEEKPAATEQQGAPDPAPAEVAEENDPAEAEPTEKDPAEPPAVVAEETAPIAAEAVTGRSPSLPTTTPESA